MTKKLAVLLSVIMILGMTSACGKQADSDEETSVSVTEEVAEVETSKVEVVTEEEVEETEDDRTIAPGDEVKIVYTNDVHSYIDNATKDDDGNITGNGLRFSKIAAMVEDMKSDGKNVVLVDAGDEIQGGIYGAMDEGETIINIMSATGYDLATPGNHDFDYGVINFLKLAEAADFQYVTCNFHSTKSKEVVLPAYQIVQMGNRKVAFIGITTPETITSSTPVYFQDENGEFIYTVDGIAKAEDLYTSVQNAIDSVRDEADVVVALGHVGIGMTERNKGISCEDIIKNTTGLDAFISGHSHTVIDNMITDKTGHEVLLTQTGNYLNNVGILTIAEDGTVSAELISDYSREDESVAALESEWITAIDEKMGEKIADLDTTLYINDSEVENRRVVRAQETNLGDFSADSVYWFFNERVGLQCDVVLQNGGGIRAQIPSGDITYIDAKKVNPFGNMVCIIEATGQQIVDALEMGVISIGQWDEEWDAPLESGGFMQVAGIKYTIDASVPSGVAKDESDMFQTVNGEYRVKDVMVYNRESGEYEPIDLDKTYNLGGINYILRNGGNGLGMFEDDELVIDYVGQDYVILAEYIKSFGQNGKMAKVNTKNSPLASYSGYLLDYENPNGAGRIKINNLNYNK